MMEFIRSLVHKLHMLVDEDYRIDCEIMQSHADAEESIMAEYYDHKYSE